MPGRSRHPASWVSARAAQVKALERHPVVGSADHRPSAEQLVEPHLPVEDIAADETEAALEIERRMDLPAEHGLGEAGCMSIYGGDDLVGGLFALFVPASTRSEIVAEVLAEQARDVLALRRKRLVESRRDQHFDDRLLRPPVDRRVQPRTVHVIEARGHDDAGRQVIALLWQHRELREL